MLKSEEFNWIDCIGSGAFSKVYYATAATRATKEYAIKVIDKGEVIKLNAQENVFRERNIMARLVHSNICNLYFTFQDSRSLYFVLELCHSGSLFSLIQFYGHLKYSDALFYSSELVSAICFLHDKNIVHRDLKPENILLGKHGHVKLADFGSAVEILRVKPPLPSSNKSAGNSYNNVKNVNNKNEKYGSTDDTKIDSRRREDSGEFYCGTAEYSAPEILKRSVEIETGIDLWAIGCIIYQMLMGRPPFQGENEYFTYNKILNFHENIFFNQQHHVSNNDHNNSNSDSLQLNKDEIKRYEKLKNEDLFMLVKALLRVKPRDRLGVYNVGELQAHQTFKSIKDWNHVELNKRKAPKLPKEVIKVHSSNIGYKYDSFLSGRTHYLQKYLCCFCKSENMQRNDGKRRPSSTAVDDQAYFQLLYEDAEKS